MLFTAGIFRSARVRGARAFSVSAARRDADFTHAVIGGGVVGLAIARQLQQREGVSTVLIERNELVGMETSSRNSEVIHAGLYYPADSLKTSLCLKGKPMLYDFCATREIPHRNCGKWIVAQDSGQTEALQQLHEHASSIGVPTHFLSKDEAKRREPDVRAEAAVLESPTTGIIDSHSLMQALHADFEEAGGATAMRTQVSRVEPADAGRSGWRIYTTDPGAGDKAEGGDEAEPVTVEALVNSAGLWAISLSNTILPPDRHITPQFAKGSYFSYASSHPKPQTLIYPAPIPGHAGLGTHLTLDMTGRIRFGPDVEWLPEGMPPSEFDYAPNPERLSLALDDIETYLPGIDRSAVDLDYSGIRPKLSRAGSVAKKGQPFSDFYIKKEEGFEGFVNLLGIESPGLTSCFAIAELVEKLLYR
ncbi:FAD dependent oxidoreductase [Lineolata rhizophorae]|uniref:L-2-hydroxyglutarate dehydrogenase, mitochondrial n=1 Tax=Lineolata rhizophorae TaxID=578093 RepID=A0A6A6NWN8_9PEZI|nr:FAD dependent oxidoreductase [Lineolata rhizophorae]